MQCNVCKKGVYKKTLTFKNTPVVNNYKKEKFSVRKTNSEILFCEICQSIKNHHDLTPNEIFENYSYSSFNTEHLKPIEDYISDLCSEKKIKNILEVGCNNGIFLERVTNLNDEVDNVTGVDPSAPKKSNNKRISFIKKFFNANIIKENKLEKAYDLIIARHMFAHVPNPEIVASQIAMCASENSYVYIENANLENTIVNKDFSQLYLEHFYAFTPKSIEKIFLQYGFEIEHVSQFSIHNGSFGVLLKKSSQPIAKIFNQNTYSAEYVGIRISEWLDVCKEFFDNLNSSNNFIWGVTAKSVMMLNMLKINTENGKNIFDSAYDFTELKKDCFVPGTNILILGEPKEETLKEINIMVGARNFSDEIIRKIKKTFPNSNIIIPPF